MTAQDNPTARRRDFQDYHDKSERLTNGGYASIDSDFDDMDDGRASATTLWADPFSKRCEGAE